MWKKVRILFLLFLVAKMRVQPGWKNLLTEIRKQFQHGLDRPELFLYLTCHPVHKWNKQKILEMSWVTQTDHLSTKRGDYYWVLVVPRSWSYKSTTVYDQSSPVLKIRQWISSRRRIRRDFWSIFSECTRLPRSLHVWYDSALVVLNFSIIFLIESQRDPILRMSNLKSEIPNSTRGQHLGLLAKLGLRWPFFPSRSILGFPDF